MNFVDYNDCVQLGRCRFLEWRFGTPKAVKVRWTFKSI